MGLEGIFFYFKSPEMYWTNPICYILCWNYSDELDSDPVCTQISLMRGPDTKPGNYLKDNVYVRWIRVSRKTPGFEEHEDVIKDFLRTYEAETWTERNPEWTLLLTHFNSVLFFSSQKYTPLFWKQYSIIWICSFRL